VRFEVLTEEPIAMRPGAAIDYRLRLRGLPLRWRTEITEWEPPMRFVDVQLRGPYAEWTHTHSFDEQDGGTLVRDAVRYRLPGPEFAVRLIDRFFVAPDTRRIFGFRHAALERILGVEGRARSGPVDIA
jgi:ligand-binding SRPBCC domain-containing protein